MITRYETPEITEIWSDKNKLGLWQETELAVIRAKVNFGKLSEQDWEIISETLGGKPIDLDWWRNRDKDIRHDLNAFIDERRRYLPLHLQPRLHEEITSYDTEEPAFGQMLTDSVLIVENNLYNLEKVLKGLALKYRYTIMMARTHGQEAELQTFGKRCLIWLKQLLIDYDNLKNAKANLKLSKISGAVGNYGNIDPAVEKEALLILGFKPFYGATQIMPRELYAPLAQALCQIVITFDKIGTDIRLGARSGQPIYQEPFGKKQKGSSIMPHKKNTISTEQLEGMARMAKGYHDMILSNIKTWEERAIEQSSVERVAWPDLFHVTIHSIRILTRVLTDLAVYPDNMLLEIINSRGCYASGEVKSFLGEKGVSFGLSAEEAYRMVQLAAFNAFKPSPLAEQLRKNPILSLKDADEFLLVFKQMPKVQTLSIQEIIREGILDISPELEATITEVQRWNSILKEIFSDPANIERFNQIFSIEHLLRNESKLYEEILGV